jgi:hypothetical protein
MTLCDMYLTKQPKCIHILNVADLDGSLEIAWAMVYAVAYIWNGKLRVVDGGRCVYLKKWAAQAEIDTNLAMVLRTRFFVLRCWMDQ